MQHIVQQKDHDRVLASGTEDDGTLVLLEDNWYFSPDAVDMTYLKISNRPYNCPYKGICYWIDLDAPELKAKNIAWVYQNPMPGYEIIKDRIAFYSRNTSGTQISTQQQSPVS